MISRVFEKNIRYKEFDTKMNVKRSSQFVEKVHLNTTEKLYDYTTVTLCER